MEDWEWGLESHPTTILAHHFNSHGHRIYWQEYGVYFIIYLLSIMSSLEMGYREVTFLYTVLDIVIIIQHNNRILNFVRLSLLLKFTVRLKWWTVFLWSCLHDLPCQPAHIKLVTELKKVHKYRITLNKNNVLIRQIKNVCLPERYKLFEIFI
jgi:hypothetical protein